MDVTTRGFLGLTVACAQCHDHKFDPIPQRDYYALLGVFNNTKAGEFPLVPKPVVDEYMARKKDVEDQEKLIKEFVTNQGEQLARIFASRTADYVMAVWTESDTQTIDESLDVETLQRWGKYLAGPQKDHLYLNCEGDRRKCAETLQRLAIDVFDEKKRIERENMIRLGGSTERRNLSQADLLSLPPEKYFLWRDLFGPKGIYTYGDPGIERFLYGTWSEHLKALRAELALRKQAMPEQYAFYQIIKDVEKLKTQKLFIRGDRNNLGEAVPSRFLTVMNHVAPQPFTTGSGRLELAEAIANSNNPLTSRVMVNRIWQAHFGEGIVRTPSNFGQLGERPTHPELLDYLASRFIENKWSIKAMHREIMLSSVYQLSSDHSAKAAEVDGANKLFWRYNRRRLDAESLRDSLLAVAGTLDRTIGGKPEKLTEKNHRRTVYGFVSRKKLDPMLALFDFPNPNTTSEQRVVTNVPLQRLFLMNSPVVIDQSQAFAERLEGDDRTKIRTAYRQILGREPDHQRASARSRVPGSSGDSGLAKYPQVLLTSNEFIYVS